MAVAYGDIDNWEALVEELVPELVELVELMVEAISPNGARWGLEKKTEHEQMMDYMENLRGNVDAWLNWIRTRVLAIQDALKGIDPQMALKAHPFHVAEAHAYAYSIKMENLWKKEVAAAQKAAEKETASPVTPPVLSGVLDDGPAT